jgi:hypothetical protein
MLSCSRLPWSSRYHQCATEIRDADGNTIGVFKNCRDADRILALVNGNLLPDLERVTRRLDQSFCPHAVAARKLLESNF